MPLLLPQCPTQSGARFVLINLHDVPILKFSATRNLGRSVPQVVKNVQYIANCFREQRATCVKAAEWKKVAKVMDRFFMWIFFMMVFLMSILIIAKAS